MRRWIQTALLAVMLLLPGCTTPEEVDEGPVDLVVHYDLTNGTIERSYQNGQATTDQGAEFEFDFALTTSSAGMMSTFSLLPGDGSDAIVIEASDGAALSHTYTTHGLFTVVLTATDDAGNNATLVLTVRVDMVLTSNQQGLQQGQSHTTEVDVTPDSNNEGPNSLRITSVVENPTSPIPNPAQPNGPAQVTWFLVDEEGEEADSRSESIGDGTTTTYETSQTRPDSGAWVLRIENGENGNTVNVQNTIEVRYSLEESPANPMPSAPE